MQMFSLAIQTKQYFPVIYSRSVTGFYSYHGAPPEVATSSITPTNMVLEFKHSALISRHSGNLSRINKKAPVQHQHIGTDIF